MSKRPRPAPPRGKPFASNLRFCRAFEVFNHETAAELVQAKLAAAPQPLDDGIKLLVLDGLKLFPAAMGVGYTMFGAPPGPGAFDHSEAASIHLWLNDKLECSDFKTQCRRLKGTFVANYGGKPWDCGLCDANIPLADHGGWKLAAKYWMQPTGKKLCKDCVIGKLREKLGDNDADIKRRFRAIFGKKNMLLQKAGVNGYVTYGYEKEDSGGDDDDDDDEGKANKKAKTELKTEVKTEETDSNGAGPSGVQK